MNKNKIIALFATGLFCTALSAQSLTTDKIPEEVKTAFKEKFPAAENVGWGKEQNGNYEAKFNMGKEKERAEFDAKGKWVETENSIAGAKVPKTVSDAVMKKQPGCKITDAEEVQTTNGKEYEVGCSGTKGKQDYRVTTDGKVEAKIEKKY